MRRLNFVVLGLALLTTACTLTFGPSQGPVISPGSATPVPTPSGDLGGQPAELTAEQIQNISQAAVQVFAAQEDSSGDLQPISSGSGTLISADGQIVTNCHVACGAPALVILLTTDINQPPQARYLAEVTAFDEELDLALLQIRQDINGNPVEASTLNLPYLERGDSNALNLGDQIRIFGYPGIGGTTITYTAGTISGFETGTVNGVEQRLFVKTDASVASGSSGGTAVDLLGRLVAIPTAVNPDVREGVTLGGIGLLLPVNLIAEVERGAPPDLPSSKLPPELERDEFEPNNSFDEAAGPLSPGEVIQGYISWEEDLDVFFFDTNTSAAVSVSLTNIPSGLDYDVYVYSGSQVAAKSESEGDADEFVEFRPAGPGRFYVAVRGFQSSSDSQPYTLTVDFDSGKVSAGAVNIGGTVIDGNTGRGFERGVFGVLNPGVTCDQFFSGGSLDMGLVTTTATTDSNGFFTLNGVPTDESYTAFFFFGSDHVCQNNWLNVPAGSGDIDLGTITLSF